MTQHDLTTHFLESIDKLYQVISDIYKEIKNVDKDNSPALLQKEICEFLCLLGPRGFLTCLGVRKTIGSVDHVLPPDREDLESMFTRLNK